MDLFALSDLSSPAVTCVSYILLRRVTRLDISKLYYNSNSINYDLLYN
jgi:hypothetical protein